MNRAKNTLLKCRLNYISSNSPNFSYEHNIWSCIYKMLWFYSGTFTINLSNEVSCGIRQFRGTMEWPQRKSLPGSAFIMVDEIYHVSHIVKTITLKKSVLLLALLKMGIKGSTSFQNHSLAFSHDFYFCSLFALESTIHSYSRMFTHVCPTSLTHPCKSYLHQLLP